MKNQILLQNDNSPDELEQALANFIDYYNNELYNESNNNMNPVDVFMGKSKQIETIRSRVKRENWMYRKLQD